jgi:hypothetical protein
MGSTRIINHLLMVMVMVCNNISYQWYNQPRLQYNFMEYNNSINITIYIYYIYIVILYAYIYIWDNWCVTIYNVRTVIMACNNIQYQWYNQGFQRKFMEYNTCNNVKWEYIYMG